MVRVSPVEVLDEAEYVSANQVHSEMGVVQVWYGGTQVRVFEVDHAEQWFEVDVWSISDEKGRAVDQDMIEGKMVEHFQVIAESMEAKL